MSMAHIDTKAAVPLFEFARNHGGLSANGWDAYGSTYWAASRDELALATWLDGLHAYPSHYEFYYEISMAYRGLQNYGAERIWLAKWVGTGKAHAADHYELGLLLLTSDAGSAQEELTQAASMDAAFAPVVETLQTSLTLAALETGPSPRLVVLGRGLGLVNEWRLAEQAFVQAANADAHNAQAWAWLGEARQQTGANGKVELDKALSLAPNDTLVHALRGLYWKRQSRYASALAEYRQAAEAEPENPEWQVALGDAYSLTGDLVSALGSYQKATALAPNNPSYWRLLAIFSADNSVEVLDIGLPAAKKAAGLAPKDPQVLDALGWSYTQAGLPYNGQQTLNQAIVLAPDFPLAHLHLAETLLRMGSQASAQDELNLARQLDANGPVGKMAAQLLRQYFP